MDSGNERQNPSESSGIESGFPTRLTKKDSVVGPFGDSPNKNDRQRRKLLNWLKETQQKRDENNKRIFCRWLGMVEKGPTTETTGKPQVVTPPKAEHPPVKTEYTTTPKVHSIPYDAFYAMTPVYYTYSTPDYYMVGQENNVAYYNNYVPQQQQRPSTPCPCYPYCYQTPTSTCYQPCEVQMSPAGPHGPPPPPPPPPPQVPTMTVISKDSTKQEPLQFNLNEWYTALEDTDPDGGQMLDALQPNDNHQPGQPTLDFQSIAQSNSSSVAYSVSSLVSVTSSQPGDFS